MFGTHDLGLFVVSGLLLNITPGADTLYIVGRSTAQGGTSGAMAALGVGAVFNCNGTLWNFLVAWSSAHVGAQIRLAGRYAVWIQRTVGGLLIALGIKLALSRQG